MSLTLNSCCLNFVNSMSIARFFILQSFLTTFGTSVFLNNNVFAVTQRWSLSTFTVFGGRTCRLCIYMRGYFATWLPMSSEKGERFTTTVDPKTGRSKDPYNLSSFVRVRCGRHSECCNCCHCMGSIILGIDRCCGITNTTFFLRFLNFSN